MTKKQELLSLQLKAVKGIKKIKKGFVFWNASDGRQQEVISDPYLSRFTNSPYVKCLVNGQEVDVSLSDSGISGGGYNPWWSFYTQEDCLRYKELINEFISFERDSFEDEMKMVYPDWMKTRSIVEDYSNLEVR